jgi:hypothetical protein
MAHPSADEEVHPGERDHRSESGDHDEAIPP